MDRQDTTATIDAEENTTEEPPMETMYYYDYAYAYDYLTLSVPFMLALLVFYLTYLGMFRRSHHRIRTKNLVAK